MNHNLLSRSSTATGCKNKRFCKNSLNTVTVYEHYSEAVFFLFNSCNKGEGERVDFFFFKKFGESFGVFGAAQFFLEAVQAETVVNALVENAAEVLVVCSI